MATSALEVLTAKGIPTDSFSGAVQHLKDLDLDQYQSLALTRELTGMLHVNPFDRDEWKSKAYLLYVAQNVVKDHLRNTQVPFADILKQSQDDTENFFVRVERGDFGGDFRTSAPVSTLVQVYEVVKTHIAAGGAFKKGNKLVLAKAIYRESNGDRKAALDRFQSELQMSKAGATTYYHNFKSGRWDAAK